MAKMAAAPNFQPPYEIQLIPTENPIILQINETMTTTLPSIISLGLPFPLMPIITRSIAPKPEKIHAMMMKVRAIISFRHCPKNWLATPEHVKGLAEHSLMRCFLLDVLQSRHRPTLRDSWATLGTSLQCTKRLSKIWHHALSYNTNIHIAT
jgi:hypothetical protein